MGAKQAKLKPETIEELTRSTPFNEQEIQLWYRGFLKVIYYLYCHVLVFLLLARMCRINVVTYLRWLK